jgi:hypothetical protein
MRTNKNKKKKPQAAAVTLSIKSVKVLCCVSFSWTLLF